MTAVFKCEINVYKRLFRRAAEPGHMPGGARVPLYRGTSTHSLYVMMSAAQSNPACSPKVQRAAQSYPTGA